MFNFGPSPDILRQLGIMPQMGQMPGMPMQGQVPDMGSAMPGSGGGLDMQIPPFMQQMQQPQQPQQGPQVPMGGPQGGPPKQGIFSRFAQGMKQGGPEASGKKMGPGGKITGAMTSMAPMFGNMLLDDEERQKQALRAY